MSTHREDQITGQGFWFTRKIRKGMNNDKAPVWLINNWDVPLEYWICKDTRKHLMCFGDFGN